MDLGPTEHTPSTTTPTSTSVFSALQRNNRVVVNNNRGLVIVHPDVLISPTKVAESRSCLRRVVLTDRIRSFGDLSAPAVMGNLKHAYIEVGCSVTHIVLLVYIYYIDLLFFILYMK